MQRDDSRCPRRPPGESGQRLRLTAELDLSRNYFGNDGHAVLNPQTLDIAVLESAAVIDQRLPRRVEVLWLIRLPCRLAVLPLQGLRFSSPGVVSLLQRRLRTEAPFRSLKDSYA